MKLSLHFLVIAKVFMHSKLPKPRVTEHTANPPMFGVLVWSCTCCSLASHRSAEMGKSWYPTNTRETSSLSLHYHPLRQRILWNLYCKAIRTSGQRLIIFLNTIGCTKTIKPWQNLIFHWHMSFSLIGVSKRPGKEIRLLNTSKTIKTYL